MKTLASTAISVLDLAKISADNTIAQTYANCKRTAQHVEQLGYTRYWLAEHHNIEGIASAATSVLIGYIAENTKTIRVGSGGIMLPNHSPLIVAEQFATLETLYPGRIDLGLGRAPGTDRQTMLAIRRDSPTRADDFGTMIEELLYYFKTPEPDQKVRAIPGAGMEIPIYILGSSLFSARLAAQLGRPYAFAGHFAPSDMMKAFDIYRSQFRPSAVLQKPYVMMGVPVIAADSDERAAYLATSVQQAFLGMVRGNRKLNLPPVPNMDAIWSPHEKQAVQSMLGLLVTGGVTRVRQELDELIRVTGADELVITSDTYEHSDRLRSYEIIMSAKKIEP
ncbi:MAG: LLM class flavin-dependent oxidoreductase [Bdellovibrionales bacterium]|nr:LLM class flavin-dependent oxidoreductase [Bdellovibrionales bacterium]